MKEKFVLFDAYGTLFDLKVDDFDIKGDTNSFLQLWRNKLLEYSWLVTLSGRWEPFDIIISKALEYSCRVFQQDFKEIEPMLMNIYRNPILFDDVLPLLKGKHIRACIMSNGDTETLKSAVEQNGIVSYIEKIFSASEVQAYKTNPKVYALATKAFTLKPEEIYFVSSNTWDIAGANFFGYQTIWVNRNEREFDRLIEKPSYEVRSLSEISNLL